MWKLPSFLNLLSNGGHLFSYSRALDDLNSKLGFEGIADYIDDKRDSVWWNSEVVGQAWITVPTGQVSKRDGQLETRREGFSIPCVLLLYSAYPLQDIIVKASRKSCVVEEGLLIFCLQFRVL